MALVDWGSCVEGDAAQISCLEPLFERVVTSFVGLAGVALFIMLLVGGFRYLLSAGDQKKLEQAKGTLTAAFLGLVVIVAAFLILRTIGVFTGVENITTFQISQ